MLQAAFTRVYGEGKYPRSVVKPLFSRGSGNEHTWETLLTRKDLTGTRGADAVYYAGIAANQGLQHFKLLEKAAGAATGGALSVVNGAHPVQGGGA